MKDFQYCVFIIIEIFAFIITFIMVFILLRGFNMVFYGQNNPAVIWCGNTVIDPLKFSANFLIPIGFLLHASAIILTITKILKKRILSILIFSLFVVVSSETIALGCYYCNDGFDGLSFLSLLWWVKPFGKILPF